MSAFTLLPSLLPFGVVKVPSLICSLENPHVDNFSSVDPVTSDGKVFRTSIQALKGLLSDTSSLQFGAALTKLLNIDLTPHDDASRISVESKAVGRYEVLQQKTMFAELCKLPQAREWIEEGIKDGQASYMLVGAMTVFDAKVIQEGSSEHQYGGSVTIPITEIAEHGIDVLDGMLDPTFSAKWTGGDTEKLSYSASGEMVWAISFRRIKFKMFRKKRVDTAYLEKTIHWTPLVKQRSSFAKEEAEALSLEVSLEPSLEERTLQDEDAPHHHEEEEEDDEDSSEDFDVVQGDRVRFFIPHSLCEH